MATKTAREIISSLTDNWSVGNDFYENVWITDDNGVSLVVGDEWDNGRHVGYTWCFNDGEGDWGWDGGPTAKNLCRIVKEFLR